MTVLLDPTAEQSPALRPRLPRPQRLDGLTIGILDIAKARGDVFLDRLDERLKERGLTVKRYRKPTNTRTAPLPLRHGDVMLGGQRLAATNTRTAPLPLRQQIATEADIVIEGLSD